jgi:hypothetical protein
VLADLSTKTHTLVTTAEAPQAPNRICTRVSMMALTKTVRTELGHMRGERMHAPIPSRGTSCHDGLGLDKTRLNAGKTILVGTIALDSVLDLKFELEN